MAIENLSPEDVAHRLAEGAILLIDVREPAEFASERIDGAVLCPLSTFDPRSLPDAEGKKIVFQCAGGVRSANAVVACQKLGLDINAHMRGGIQAWKAAGLPTVTD